MLSQLYSTIDVMSRDKWMFSADNTNANDSPPQCRDNIIYSFHISDTTTRDMGWENAGSWHQALQLTREGLLFDASFSV